MGQLGAVDPDVVVEFVLVLEVLATYIAPILGHLVVVVVLALLLARRFDRPDELLLGDLGNGAHVVLGVLLLDLDDEPLRKGWQNDGFGRFRFLLLFARGGRCGSRSRRWSASGALILGWLLKQTPCGQQLRYVQLVLNVLDDDVMRHRRWIVLVRIDLLLQVHNHPRWRLQLLLRGWRITRLLLLLRMVLGSGLLLLLLMLQVLLVDLLQLVVVLLESRREHRKMLWEVDSIPLQLVVRDEAVKKWNEKIINPHNFAFPTHKNTHKFIVCLHPNGAAYFSA